MPTKGQLTASVGKRSLVSGARPNLLGAKAAFSTILSKALRSTAPVWGRFYETVTAVTRGQSFERVNYKFVNITFLMAV
jgi:hypothetical protein